MEATETIAMATKCTTCADTAHTAAFAVKYDYYSGCSKVISAFRIKHGLSQSALAKLLDVKRATVGKWERGQTKPSYMYWKKFAELSEGYDKLP